MTLIRKLSFIVYLFVVIMIVLLILKNYLFSLIIFFLLAGLLFIYYKMGLDEAVIYYVRYKDGKVRYQNILDQFGKKGKSAVRRLILQNIIEKEDDNIILKKMHINELWKYIKSMGEARD